MILKLFLFKRRIAFFFLLLLSIELIVPAVAVALTNGPSQPEMAGFSPIGNTDMVDLFSGDFSYNIPIMDVGGYPLNLVYNSGSNMDDEASWVGYGWSLTPGTVNRQLRGIPDDFNGEDQMERQMSMKDHKTWGVKGSISLELLGLPISKVKPPKKKKKNVVLPKLGFSLGIKNDNYRGIGVDMGLNAGLGVGEYSETKDTKGVTDPSYLSNGKDLGSINLTGSSFDGLTLSGDVNFAGIRSLNDKEPNSFFKSIGFSMNTRQGNAQLTLGGGFNFAKFLTKSKNVFNPNIENSICFADQGVTPTIDIPTENLSFTLELSGGVEWQIFYIGAGLTGFYSKQYIPAESKRINSPAYGFIHSEKGKRNSKNAILDFNREKDIPYLPQVKTAPIPVSTNDFFVVSGEFASGQFKPVRNSPGIFFDKTTENKSTNTSLSFELGAFNYFDIGSNNFIQNTHTKTQLWKSKNNYLKNSFADFTSYNPSYPSEEPVYFKKVGEPVPFDGDYYEKLWRNSPVSVALTKLTKFSPLGPASESKVITKNGEQTISSPIKRTKRETRNNNFNYLTASEAKYHALDIKINNYPTNQIVLSGCGNQSFIEKIDRQGGYRKEHHISEITVLNDDGNRAVYGIPVYNTYQEEVSFSVGGDLTKRQRGIIQYSSQENSISNNSGRDGYFSKQIMPAYTTCFLLTGILSPDYVDRTHNGITDDDIGTAVKFNYTKLPYEYNWRTPYDSSYYSEGFLTDTRDDKASYTFGKKELWYMHSIESKTMVAYFVLEEREDGFGVKGSDGGKDSTKLLKRLKEVRLYSKADIIANGGDLSKITPVKTAHFVYDYSIGFAFPNSKGNYGKLTLKRVYFTYGKNAKGKLNPYDFEYNKNLIDSGYQYKQYDRWGNYKPVSANPNGLLNSEYPYTIQDTAVTNTFVSVWQLSKITLPSGGIINVSYESDDYAYVQNKRACDMFFVKGITNPNQSDGLINSNTILVSLTNPVSSDAELKAKYFERGGKGEKLYFKFYMDLDNKGHSEFVPGYATIKEVHRYNSTTAAITLEPLAGENPFAKTGWQFLRLNLPKYAYPGSENIDDDDNNLKKLISALLASVKSFTELFKNYEKRAKSSKYSNKIDLSKSWVRLADPNFKKLGGGLRVRRIDVSDEWSSISGVSGAKTASYAQVYEYTKKITFNGVETNISSGVASYEPMIGNDENPFRQPINYNQTVGFGLNNEYYIEEPFGESFFPAPSVGYSSVTVRSVGANQDESNIQTGTTITEFYTAKDYPTFTDQTHFQSVNTPKAYNKLLGLLGVKFEMHVGISGGYLVELNNMHGKLKSTKMYNRSNQLLSSVEYIYKSENQLSEEKKLNNDVNVIRPDGTVSTAPIAQDVELFTDMRENLVDNIGISMRPSGGAGAIWIIPLPFAAPIFSPNTSRKIFRSSSVIKVVQRFGILEKVIKKENGSTVETENLLWDAVTGNVLETKVHNEFKDPVYSFTYPAHWAYDGMGPAYLNLGAFLQGFSTNSSGQILNSTYSSILVPGDELVCTESSDKGWVIRSTGNELRVIDENGFYKQFSSTDVRVLRSGRRNMASSAIATITSLTNPVVNGQLSVSQLTRILDAKAIIFNEEWSAPVAFINKPGTITSSCIASANVTSFVKSAICSNVYDQSHGIEKMSLFAWRNDTASAGSMLTNYKEAGNQNNFDTSIITNFHDGLSGYFFSYFLKKERLDSVTGLKGKYYYPYFKAGDTASLGYCNLLFDTVALAGGGSKTVFKQSDFQCDKIYTSLSDVPSCFGQECINYRSFYVLENSGCSYSLKKYTFSLYHNGTAYCRTNTTYAGEALKFDVECVNVFASTCSNRVGDTINPYVTGILGNWRPWQTFVYQSDRSKGNPPSGKTDIRNAGYYKNFETFWSFNGTRFVPTTSFGRWVWSSYVTYYNSKGQELENKDALNRYSSAQFGYLESVPVAVASNARFREIGYDNFEDYGYGLDCSTGDSCNNKGHFSFRKMINGSTVLLNSQNVHSGKYSLRVNGNVIMYKSVTAVDNTGPVVTLNGSGLFTLSRNDLGTGFSPTPGKKYILSVWVKDGAPRTKSTNITIAVNGYNLVNTNQQWPIVEGWKRIEVPFMLPANAGNFALEIGGQGPIYIDDIRVLPYDAQIKTYAYDPVSMRLMAEMDENNFATFYEYDDEGVLVRVKKETDRGIMTIKETRSSYRPR